jgi:hypothetical protein
MDHSLYGLPLGSLYLLQILDPNRTMMVNILPTLIAIEQLVFVRAFLRLAHEEAFVYTTDAAILEKLSLCNGQWDCRCHL